MLARRYKIHSKQPVRGGPRGYFHVHFVRPWHQMRVTPLLVSDAAGESDETASDASLASDTGRGLGEPMHTNATQATTDTVPSATTREPTHDHGNRASDSSVDHNSPAW